MEGKRRGEELVVLSLLFKGPVSVGVCVPLSLLKSASPLADPSTLFPIWARTVSSVETRSASITGMIMIEQWL